MTNVSNLYGATTDPVTQAYDDAGEKLEQASAVKTDLSFVGIFANFIKKMDDVSQAAQ